MKNFTFLIKIHFLSKLIKALITVFQILKRRYHVYNFQLFHQTPKSNMKIKIGKIINGVNNINGIHFIQANFIQHLM